jgi:dUTPase
MTEFTNENKHVFDNLSLSLLENYPSFMHLKIYVDNDNDLKKIYLASADKHNEKIVNKLDVIDAGFDLFAPGNESDKDELEVYGETLRFFGTGWSDAGPVNKLDYKICCSAKMITSSNNYNTGFYMYPRSSLSKTQLRLANSVGIIDAGYRGHLMAMFDVVNIVENESEEDIDEREADYFGKKYDRYVQICAPNLAPIVVEIVDTKEDLGNKTERGDCGFGSTGR